MMMRRTSPKSGLRWNRARRSRPLHVGRDAARMLSEHADGDRSTGAVCSGAYHGIAKALRSLAESAQARETAIEGLRRRDLLPFVRGRVSRRSDDRKLVSDAEDVLRFVNSKDGAALAHLGTSCPDHFIRTKIRPLFVPATAGRRRQRAEEEDRSVAPTYRAQTIAAYYHAQCAAVSPAFAIQSQPWC
jgi:rhamnose utilization protein RhaD (predicted bifunctional aldolase and dehydrogenase)